MDAPVTGLFDEVVAKVLLGPAVQRLQDRARHQLRARRDRAHFRGGPRGSRQQLAEHTAISRVERRPLAAALSRRTGTRRRRCAAQARRRRGPPPAAAPPSRVSARSRDRGCVQPGAGAPAAAVASPARPPARVALPQSRRIQPGTRSRSPPRSDAGPHRPVGFLSDPKPGRRSHRRRQPRDQHAADRWRAPGPWSPQLFDRHACAAA